MRRTIVLRDQWYFTKEELSPQQTGVIEPDRMERVCVPHTWNALDGQDGGNDYTRGACWYQRSFTFDSGWQTRRFFLEFQGVNAVCDAYFNGRHIGRHEGGYSTFRFELTDAIQWDVGQRNILSVRVDNSDNSAVYPGTADFTFFGGIYRDVRLIVVHTAHFDLMDDGSCGVYVTPVLQGNKALVTVQAKTVTPQPRKTEYTILDAAGEIAAQKTVQADGSPVELRIVEPELWDGRAKPYLYTLVARILHHGTAVDEVRVPFGVRYFSVDAKKGFFLNGHHLPLHGVSRHQDRENMGWAITEREHREDMELICEVGATSIRLAHYQHSPCFYDLCDQNGMVVWAEIPFISVMSEEKRAHLNARGQLTELIKQNYNHPSICFWGIGNELGIGGESEALYENLKDLNALAKELDPTRLTTCAQVMATANDSPLNYLTDVLAYNHYFGWYVGKTEDFSAWLDTFHEQNKKIPLAISEYGCEGITRYHTDTPQCRDYSEEYQALYHETAWAIFEKRPYLWATYVWNMFDFASDQRDEGGVKGRNHKGLITYDRKVKKDAFYFYKANWSQEPFVHIAGSRYAKRPGEEMDVKVYSSCREVSLTVNGRPFGSKRSKSHVFLFEHVPLQSGENRVEAGADGCRADLAAFLRVEQPDPAYQMPLGASAGPNVSTWFEKAGLPAGDPACYSVADDLGALLDCPAAHQILEEFAGELLHHPMLQTARGFSVAQIASMAGTRFPAEALAALNEALQAVKK